MRRIAHFLNSRELAHSPPNEALIACYHELGFDVDLFTPGADCVTRGFGRPVLSYDVRYGRRWIIQNCGKPNWRRYAAFSGTSEDPAAVVGVLSALHRRPAIILADEIMSGSYRGDRPEYWKRLCRWAMRRAQVNIVNDASRIQLQRDYAGLGPNQTVVVYPAAYRNPPKGVHRQTQRKLWGIPEDALVIGFSGWFGMTAGAAWIIEALQRTSVWAVIQPLGIDPLAHFLLTKIAGSERLYVQKNRLEWREAWAQAAAIDVGVAVYTSAAPQFQHMGVSSNRLCMFLGMGVPVIASRQQSFQFLEDYCCGVLVDEMESFLTALEHIRLNLDVMRRNAHSCWTGYIDAQGRYDALLKALRPVLES